MLSILGSSTTLAATEGSDSSVVLALTIIAGTLWGTWYISRRFRRRRSSGLLRRTFGLLIAFCLAIPFWPFCLLWAIVRPRRKKAKSAETPPLAEEPKEIEVVDLPVPEPRPAPEPMPEPVRYEPREQTQLEKTHSESKGSEAVLFLVAIGTMWLGVFMGGAMVLVPIGMGILVAAAIMLFRNA